jgi:hypothetical protein
MPTYTWLQYAAARQQLAARLADSGMVFWSDAELGIYICQALRIFNSLTFTWKTEFVFFSNNLWNSLALLPASPRLRTLTDTYAYTEMEYMLLEPPTGNTWTGTSQFGINDLSQALQRRRDEIILVSNCNQSLMPNIPLTPGTRRTTLPDNVLDIARVRYIPTVAPPDVAPPPTTLNQDDTVAQEFYEPPLWQLQQATPNTFSMTSEPPISFDTDYPPNLPGTYEAVVLKAGAPFDPASGSTLLNIPDDFAWVAEWGALADLLGRESEATDIERAMYANSRYQDGLKLLLNTPWIMLGKVNGQAVSVDSMDASDRYMPEWDTTPATFGPSIVIGGIDFFAAPLGSGIGVTVLGNAPVPTLDADYVQVSRSNWDTVLDLAQSRAMFKQGGEEFKQGLQLEARAIHACAAENSRLISLGSFADILVQRGQAQNRDQERYMAKQEQQS